MNNLGISPLISDGMIIQRDVSFPLWSQKKVTVSFLDKSYESKQINGKWLVTLDPAQAGGPFTLKIKSDDDSAVINDVYSGDIWLCGGQSNMEVDMHQLKKKYPEEWKNLTPLLPIHHFRVPKEWDFIAPHDDISGGRWKTASKETFKEFSAVGWFFAKFMYKQYGVPIGLINSTWGGTPVESWMSPDALKEFPEKTEECEFYRCRENHEEAFKNSGYAIEEKDYFFAQKPSANFNTMIYPVLKFPLTGVIWYQGESNDCAPEEYGRLFKLMIEEWRMHHKKMAVNSEQKRELPFLFVQLPVWKAASDNDEHSAWAHIRMAQAGALEIPDTGMACALELGEWDDIHPKNKKDVGYRLFLAAEKVLFASEKYSPNTSPGPIVRKIENGGWKIENERMFIFFDNCGGGLTAAETEAHVSVIGSNGYKRLPARIEGKDCLSIDLSSVKNPRMILYAWADNPKDRQLFNSDGLPVIPFKIKL